MKRFSRHFKLGAILMAIILLATFSTAILADGDGSGPDIPPPPDDPPPGGENMATLNISYFALPLSIFMPIGF